MIPIRSTYTTVIKLILPILNNIDVNKKTLILSINILVLIKRNYYPRHYKYLVDCRTLVESL